MIVRAVLPSLVLIFANPNFLFAGTIQFSVPIEAAQAVPANVVPTTGSGIASFTLHTPEGGSPANMDYHIQIFGLDLRHMSGFGPPNPQPDDDDVTAVHFHNAPFGFQGPAAFAAVAPNDDVIQPITMVDLPPGDALGGVVRGNWSDADAAFRGLPKTLTELLPELFAGNIYLNIHTRGNPNSDIRAQLIISVPEPTSLALAVVGLLSPSLFGRRRRRRR